MEKCQWEELCRGTAGRLEQVRARIAAAAQRSGRNADSVKLVAVTKYTAGTDGLESSLAESGAVDFGENRVSRLIEKWHLFDAESKQNQSGSFPPFPDPRRINWHFIGSLQRNKVRRVLPYVSLLHSVDTPELYEAVARIMDEENQDVRTDSGTLPFPEKIPVLLEVNISGEGNKHGFQPETFLDQAGPILERKNRVEVRGLMGMGGLASSPSEVRAQFAILRSLLDEARGAFPALTGLAELSMGMSGDFEIAVEEGATIVRIGSILYP